MRLLRRLARHALAVSLLALALAIGSGAPAVRAAEAPSPSGDGGGPIVDPFIELDPLAVSLIADGRLVGSLIVSASLELVDATKRPEVERNMPRLHDAYLREMTSFGERRTRVDRPIDVDALGQALQRATDRHLGPGAATVLILFATVRKT